MFQYGAVSCRVLQCVFACCSMLLCVAVCCGVLQCVAVCCSEPAASPPTVPLCVHALPLPPTSMPPVCCSVMQYVSARALCFSFAKSYPAYIPAHRIKLQHTAHNATVCNSLQAFAARCSILQHTAAHCNTLQRTATRGGKANKNSAHSN